MVSGQWAVVGGLEVREWRIGEWRIGEKNWGMKTVNVDDAIEICRREKRFLENIIDMVPESLVVVNKDLRIKKANRTFYETFQNVTGRSLCDILQDKEGKLACELTRLFGTEDMLEKFELHYWSEKLGDLTFEITARGIIHADAEEAEVLVVARDRTERKMAEEALLESEEKYSSLVESTEDSIYLVDRNCGYLFANKKYLSRVPLLTGKVKGRKYSEVHSKEETKRFADKVKEVFETGKSLFYEYRNPRDGRYFVRTLSPVKEPGGIITALTVISKDITNRKLSEEKLEKAYQDMKATTAQLVHNEKMSALGELTASVAHELNQPLNNIKISSQSLLRDINKNRLDINALPQDLKEVVEQVNKMAGIVDHMRIFTRRLEGMNMEEIDINESITNMFVLIGSQLRSHNIEVVKELAPDLRKILGDSIGLEQVLTNLMINARGAVEDFRETGRIIEIRSFMNNENEVAVSIKDNGGGIPSHIRDRIFEPFFTTKPPGQGTGLGLGVSLKIIEEHNGRIELEVEEGKGSMFTIILPIAE